ncbi:MAG: hypothetical protein HKN58_08070 [Xanthomonadales bacterium]|nr:hypothetical protein [Xanthomonadales bacterium]
MQPDFSNETDVLRYSGCEQERLRELLARFSLQLVHTAQAIPIPGSFWGDEEAGLVGDHLFARGDTPVHSILHEACHFICMDDRRRHQLHTDAGGDDLEECAVCYLQIALAEHLPGMGSERMMRDMDRWGYSFRLGSARTWFRQDAGDARAWLVARDLLTRDGQPTFRKRKAR